MVKLSIIVPIYNVEQFLRKCVDSLLNQDIPSSEYEIILVDDESPDACPKICDGYAAAHKNVHVVHRENGGLSAARNSGIEVAKGEYIMFVDSDDYIEPNVLGVLMKQIEREQLDVLRYDYQNVRLKAESEYEVFQPYKTPHEVDKREDVVDGIAYLNERMGYECYSWQFIVRRAILIDDRCRDDRCLFTEGIHFEDVDWLPRMMLRARRVNSTVQIVYNYCMREGSITQEKEDLTKRNRNVSDAMIVIKNLKSIYDTNPICYWLKNMISVTTIAILNTVSRFFYKEKKDYIGRLKDIGVFPLRVADIGGSYKYIARMCNISPFICVGILYLFNKLK